MTGLPVIPLAVAASGAWRLGSWDGFMIPKPFAEVRIEYLPPRLVGRDACREEMAALAAALGDELNDAGARLAGDRAHAPRSSSAEGEGGVA
jgi:lysophospholipid acyltransferase (LPLAT)-like uncharacterized protein